MSQKHTPGPWSARFIYRMIKAARADRDIFFESNPENDWADASLIAVAPEFLAVCERYLAWEKGSYDVLGEYDEIVRDMAKVVAWAKGIGKSEA